MPVYSLKLNIYDPEVIYAFERLRKSRKQAAFNEAVKQFLSTDKGFQILLLMEGKTTTESSPAPITLQSGTQDFELPTVQAGTKTHLTFSSQFENSKVLESILK